MIGKQPSVREVALTEEPPEPVSLTCHEDLDEEELIGAPYIFSGCCALCPGVLRIVVITTTGGLQTLKSLLSSSELSFCCAKCAKERHYYG
ncbi:E7 protein [Eumops bonariensis papillomavirus type 2]|nr:E7 protein [Eumops bonariensis papillomavirus type 2]